MIIKFRSKSLIGVALLLLFFFGHSRVIYANEINSVRITRITDERGVTPSATFAIVKDAMGFMWFGTIDGLYRYDGHSYKIFRNQKDNRNSLTNNNIRTLCLAKDGLIWIGTQGGGLDCFNPQSETFTNYSTIGGALSGNSIWKVFEDSNGNIWVGISGKGVDCFNPKTKAVKSYLISNDEASDLFEIRAIEEDRNGNIWVGTGGHGIYIINPLTGVMERITHSEDGLSDNGVFDIYQDREGEIWISTFGNGIDCYDVNNRSFAHFKHNPNEINSLTSNLTYRIIESKQGGIWIATEYGLCHLDSKKSEFTSFVRDNCNPNSLSDNRIRAIFLDEFNTLWIGNETGVNKLIVQDRFDLYQNTPSNANSLNSGIVRSILEDHDGKLWIGLIDKGLAVLDRKADRYAFYEAPSKKKGGLTGNHITALFQDSRNTIWLGEWDSGLLRYHPESDSFEHVLRWGANQNGLLDNRIQLIRECKPGILWIGTEGGLNRYDIDKQELIAFVHKPGDPNSLNATGIQSNAFVQDSAGNVWVGMWAGGFNKIEFSDLTQRHATFKGWKNSIENKEALSSDNVISLHLSKNNILWIGTFGGGLMKFDTKTEKFTHYTTDRGLPNNVIYSIIEDKQGNLWMSTDKGISSFDPNTEMFVNFDRMDGLQDNHFFWGSSYQSASGEIFMGGINGFNGFFPEMVSSFQVPVNPVITSLKASDRVVGVNFSNTHNDTIFLSYTDNFLTFEFASLNYIEPHKDFIRYRMDGVDADWNYLENRKYTTYTDLSPGTYIFRLNVSTNLSRWTNSDLLLTLIIIPPWYKTIWALTLFVLLGVLLIWGMYYLRVQMYNLQQKRLEEQVILRTNEITLKNSQLESTLTELEHTQKALLESEKMASLGILSAGMAHEINNPLNFINLSVESLKLELDEAVAECETFDKERFALVSDLLDHASTGVERISSIVSSLKQYSRKGGVETTPVDISKVVNSSITIIHSKIPSFVSFNTDLRPLPFVKCKPEQIGQVIINVLDNAIDAIVEKSVYGQEAIDVFTDQVTYNGLEYVAVHITNTGTLLSNELLDHLYDPFYTTKAPNKGTGLGMSISYNIIKEHKGFILAENFDTFVQFSILIPLN